MEKYYNYVKFLVESKIILGRNSSVYLFGVKIFKIKLGNKTLNYIFNVAAQFHISSINDYNKRFQLINNHSWVVSNIIL